MTLLVAARAKDCIVALSDRKERAGGFKCNEVTKYYLSTERGFYIALAGDGDVARQLLDELAHLQPSAADIFKEIDRIVAELFVKNQAGQVVGRLIVADGDEFKVYTISIAFGISACQHNTDAMPVEGDRGAVAVCKNLARGVSMSNMHCEDAVRCLHTIADCIAETVDTVGDRTRYGIDIVVFASAGTVTQLRRRTDRMGTIRVIFESSDAGLLLNPDGGA